MRIACVHVPQFALQSLGRVDPSLRGAAVAVAGAGSEPAPGRRAQAALHGPIVLACSRAAWALGVRLGMTASAARFVSPDLRIVHADPQLERETARAIADALLGVSSLVDLGGRVASAGSGAHLAMYCEVPSKTRGATFGERLLALLDDVGIMGRIGIADDRFTAWVAAAHGGAERRPSARQAAGGSRGAGASRKAAEGSEGEAAGARREGGGLLVPRAVREHVSRPEDDGRDGGVSRQASEALRALTQAGKDEGTRGDDRGVISVPRGGSAAFLAPQPLALLAISSEVQHMLESLGVRTLGEFAALPAPSVARPIEFDYQALARGDSGGQLRPYAPEAPIREELVVSSQASADVGLFTGAAALTSLAERLALRLAGRQRVATRLELTVTRNTADRVIPVTLDRPTSLASDLIEIMATAIGEGPIARLRVVVAGEAIAGASGVEVDITEPLV
ncbi:MAG TPA: hypothetical protein VGC42_15130, partial [Kofleriaceae bacterium]